MNRELQALGDAIRQIRKARKISQVALGTLSGLHRTYICDIERGTRNLTFLNLLKLARALGMTVSEITRQAEVGGPLALEADEEKPSAPKASMTTPAGLKNSSLSYRPTLRRTMPPL